MPSRNSIKEFTAGEYYHLYNRGVEKREIFLDDQDYTVFLGLLKKYLVGEVDKTTNYHKFNNLTDQVKLLAYCLMPNHFHLMVYQSTDDGITKLMRRVMTGYVMYFNNKYNRVGSLFQGRYKASHINADAYLHHISRYIHMNPEDFQSWPYSSLDHYLGKQKTPSWVDPKPVMELFDSTEDYKKFVNDYIDSKNELSVLKWQLANTEDY